MVSPVPNGGFAKVLGVAVAAICLLCATAPSAGAAQPAIERAFEAAQWAHLSSAGRALAQLATRSAAGDGALAELVREKQDLAAEIAARESALGGVDDDDARLAMRGEIESLAAGIALIDARLAREFPRFADLADPAPLTIAQAQALLGEDEALLFFLPARDGVFVWAVSADDAAWHRTARGTAWLEGEIAHLRRQLDPHAATRGAQSLVPGAGQPRVAPFDRARAHDLHVELLDPVGHVLDGTRHLLVVPGGPVAALPLGVLVTEAPLGDDRDPEALRGTAWLAARYATTTLPSVDSLRTVRALDRPEGAGGPERPFVGIGAPILGGRQVEETVLATSAQDFLRGVFADVEAVRNLPSLPQTEPELRRLADLLGASEDDLLIGSKATETAVKQADLSSAGIIAFATHGLLSGELRGLAEPALVLTPPQAATAEDDGLLTASEIAQLRLSAEWVILSACNTAGSDGRPDGEGLSGLARAFLYAGARSILVSHWPVRDDAAARLTTMTIAGMAEGGAATRAEALNRAMLELMRDGRDHSLAHPSVWAPFVIVGEGWR